MSKVLFVLLCICILLGVSVAQYPNPITDATVISTQGSSQTTTIAAYILLCSNYFVTLNTSTTSCVSVLDYQGNYINGSCPAAIYGSADMFCLSTGCYSLNTNTKSISAFNLNYTVAKTFVGQNWVNPVRFFGYHNGNNIDFLVVDGVLNSTIRLVTYVYTSNTVSNPNGTVVIQLNNTAPIVGFFMPTDTSFQYATLGDTTLRGYSFSAGGKNPVKSNNFGTFTSIQVVGRDYNGRIFVWDLDCNCIKVMDTSGNWVRTITGAVNPKVIQTSRNAVYVLDDNGITRYDEPIQLAYFYAQNATCNKGGNVTTILQGGNAPFNYKLYPDKTAIGNSISTQSFTTFINPRSTLIAPYYIYADAQSQEWIDVFKTGAEIPQADSSVIPPYAGQYSYGMSLVQGATYGFRSFNLINTTAFGSLEMMVNPGSNTDVTFTVSIDAFVSQTFLPGQLPANTWTKISFDLTTTSALTYSYVYFTDLSNDSCVDCNWLFVDNIVLLPYASNVRYIQVTDFCLSVLTLPEFTIAPPNNPLSVTVDMKSPSCAPGQGTKLTDGSLNVTISGGVAPYTTTWVGFGNSSAGVLTWTDLSPINNIQPIYDNAVEPPFTVTSTMSNQNFADSSLYHSAPYSLSAAPQKAGESFIFNYPSTLNTSSFSGIEFWVHGGPTGQQLINVQLTLGYPVGAMTLLHTLIGLPSIPPNVWVRAFYPLAGSGVNYFTGISFSAFGTWNQPRIYFDDIRLIGNSYSVTVKDNSSCSITTYVGVPQATPITVTPIVRNVTCFDAGNGQVTASVNGGTGPYTYVWTSTANTRSTTNTMTNLPPGANVTVKVTDANQCTAPVAFAGPIVQPPPISIYKPVVSDAKCNSGYGYISAGVRGGVSPFTYHWAPKNTHTSSSYYEVSQPLPGVVFEDYFANGFGIGADTSNGTATVVCNGVKDSENPLFKTFTGYCAITAQVKSGASTKANSYVISLGCRGCIDLSEWAGVQMAVRLATPSDASHLYVTLYESGTPVSTSVKLFTTTPSSDWTKVSVTFNDWPAAFADYIVITTNANTGLIYIDDVVLTPYSDAPGVTGTNVNSGYIGEAAVTAGQWVLSVTDENNCPTQQTFTVNQPSAISITYITTPTIGNLKIGEIILFVSGGNPPYKYYWPSNVASQQSSIAIGLRAGTYPVGVTDENGCIAQAEITVYSLFGETDDGDGVLITDSSPPKENKNLFGIIAGVVGALVVVGAVVAALGLKRSRR